MRREGRGPHLLAGRWEVLQGGAWCHPTAGTTEQGACRVPASAPGKLLPGAWAPWGPCSGGLLFLGRRGLLSHIIQPVPTDYLPCARYYAGE